MSRSPALPLLVAAFTCPCAAATGQLGELQVGVVGSYGVPEPYRGGAGLVLGIAPGRLAYVGLRWTYQFGTTTTVNAGGNSSEVRNRTQIFATELGVQIPLGHVEVVPSVSIGAVRFAQRSRSGNGEAFKDSKEFLAAPGLSLQVNASRIAFIPELQYYFTGRPGLPWPVRNRGLVASMRVVFLSEIRRIRR